MKRKNQTFYIKDFVVNTESDFMEDELLDTDVYINREYLFTIAGVYIGDFVAELRLLIDKYEI